MNLPGIAIAIATHNRAEDLSKTLDGLLQLATTEVPAFEVLVVANNCTDRTASIVEAFQRRCPWPVHYIEEPRTGLSHARNRAIAEARFEIVAFLDDDVDVDPAWLQAMWDAFVSGEHAAVGGRAYLIYPFERPTWLTDRREGLLTRVEYGPSPRRARPDELYGVNLAVRKSWMDRAGGFRTDLGRQGLCLLGSEESELLERIAKLGGTLLYEPRALVGHRVPAARLQRRWFWSRIYWGKVGEIRTVPDKQITDMAIVKAMARMLRAAAVASGTSMMSGFRSPRVFESLTDLSARCGEFVGLTSRYFGRTSFGSRRTSGSPDATQNGATAERHRTGVSTL